MEFKPNYVTYTLEELRNFDSNALTAVLVQAFYAARISGNNDAENQLKIVHEMFSNFPESERRKFALITSSRIVGWEMGEEYENCAWMKDLKSYLHEELPREFDS